MKRLSLLYISLLAISSSYSQSHLIKAGILQPVNNKSITILPTTKDVAPISISLTPNQTKKIVLVGGRMNPAIGGNEILTNKTPYNNGFNSLVDDNVNNSSNYNSKTASTNNQTNNNLAPLTDITYTSNNQQVNNNGSKSFTNNTSQAYSASLEPLTYTPPPTNNNKKTSVETLDPSRFNNNKATINQANPNKPVYVSSIKTNKTETVGPRTQSSNNQLKMIDLLPIVQDNSANVSANGVNAKQSNGMPDLAPIEGIEIKSSGIMSNAQPTSTMPDLAPIDEEKNMQQLQPETVPQEVQVNDNKNNTKLRGFNVPKGTILKANNTKTYILKPAIPQKAAPEDDVRYGKPSAGGAMSFLFDDELAEKNTHIVNNFQTNHQLQQAAKKHQHDPNNPCCKVQVAQNAVAKPITKKPVYKKKRKYYSQQAPVLITYKQDPVQTQNIERIVYVPVQSQQKYTQQPTAKSKVVQEVYQPPVQQQVISQPKEKVVYRDYTNKYSKQPSQQSSSTASKDPKTYYNPNNYANGLNAGPTSGDYPIASKSSDANMQYTFYVNNRGKYGLSLYNNNCSILLSQNGKVTEFKEFGDPNAPQPKLNYFGSPESIGGIPIEYNYNRSVHKIGNIIMDYDFEGFFKTVGRSNVYYNSRSSLSRVDNVNVRYDAGGNVTSVDNNNGLIQYNP
ncbi:MAG: hypothetical protein ACOVO1_08815 [Chitinophagaceae bacterium]